jgi:signal transduction histidine kinase
MTDNSWREPTRRIPLEARPVGAPPEMLDCLRLELAELRASRKRLVLAAAADRRGIERDLHDGVQQHLVALAVNLQLAAQAADAGPAATKALLEEMARDVQQALDEAAQLAERIYPLLVEGGGLAVALRSAAAGVGLPVLIGVAAGVSYPPEAAATVYLCCRMAFERAGPGAQATVRVGEEEGALAFEVVADGAHAGAAEGDADSGLAELRDRVEALGGRLTIRSEPGRRIWVSGTVPLSG